MRLVPAALCALLLVSGCITESTGGGPEPAPPDVQLAAHLDLARGYLDQGDINRARDPLKRALEIDPRSAEALTLMAVMYQSEQEPELAEQYYQRALRSDSRHAMALFNYGTFLYGQRRFEDALVPLRTLVRDPAYRGRAQAYENLGLTELRVGNIERARGAFERALSFNTAQPRSSLEMAAMAYAEDDFAAASRYYEGYKVRARQTPRSLCLGLRLARRTDDGNQRASYEMALRNLYPNSAEAKRCLDEG